MITMCVRGNLHVFSMVTASQSYMIDICNLHCQRLTKSVVVSRKLQVAGNMMLHLTTCGDLLNKRGYSEDIQLARSRRRAFSVVAPEEHLAPRGEVRPHSSGLQEGHQGLALPTSLGDFEAIILP